MKLFSSYITTALDGETPVEHTLLTGSVNSTIVRSLEVINNTEETAIVTIRRLDDAVIPVAYGTVPLRIHPGDYVIGWADCQVALPLAHVLSVSSSVAGIQVVANAVEK